MENGFSHIQCPLCGKFSGSRTFDPTKFDNDINGVRFEGLGYAKGFGVADRGSILDSGDPVIDLISDRVLEISRFLMDAGLITDNMMASHLPILESNIETQAKLESEVHTLEVDNEELKNKNAGLKKEIVKLDSEVDALEVDIEDLERKNAGLKNEVKELREQLESIDQYEDYAEAEDETDQFDDYIGGLTSMVEEVIGEEFYDQFEEDDDASENLKNMIIYLINEYDALVG